MDNPKPDATPNVRPDEPEARRRRDAGVPTKDERVDGSADVHQDVEKVQPAERDPA